MNTKTYAIRPSDYADVPDTTLQFLKSLSQILHQSSLVDIRIEKELRQIKREIYRRELFDKVIHRNREHARV